jgi:hypothetical protein
MELAVWLWAMPNAKGIIDSSLQMQLGNPSNATANINDHGVAALGPGGQPPFLFGFFLQGS